MLASLFAALLCVPAPVVQDPPAPQERELSEREIARRAARDIKDVLKSESIEDILETLREKGRIDDTDVVRAVGGAVDDDREVVRWAGVITLRYNPCSRAVSELLSAARAKEIRSSDALLAEVFRGLGQHGHPRALSLLTDGFGPGKESDVLTGARIDAVGRIRTPDAVNSLIKFARSGFAKGHEERICTALQGLTGESLGSELRPWVLWWNRAKLGYHFPEEMPRAPARWTSIWEVPTPQRIFDRIPGQGGDRAGGQEEGERPPGGRRGGGRRGGDGGNGGIGGLRP